MEGGPLPCKVVKAVVLNEVDRDALPAGAVPQRVDARRGQLRRLAEAQSAHDLPVHLRRLEHCPAERVYLQDVVLEVDCGGGCRSGDVRGKGKGGKARGSRPADAQ